MNKERWELQCINNLSKKKKDLEEQIFWSMESISMSLKTHQREKESPLQDQRPKLKWMAIRSKFELFVYLLQFWLIFSIKRHGYYPLLRNGELIPVTVLLNEQTKFSKLQVGKQIVTARQRQGSENFLYPQSIAVIGKAPL